jgi:hypothetical protein
MNLHVPKIGVAQNIMRENKSASVQNENKQSLISHPLIDNEKK